MNKNLIIRSLGLRDYNTTYHAMRTFTESRAECTGDEIWLLEHPPVFTLGRKGSLEHIHDAGNIPVIQTDRGGQVTYHGPGQLVVYLLIDLQRRTMGIRSLVNTLQDSVVAMLMDYGIDSSSRPDAPGVYVKGRKIASVGLRVRRGCCYHGLSLNIAMDLTPFECINPCGYAGLEVTQLCDLKDTKDTESASIKLIDLLAHHLGYERITRSNEISDTVIDIGPLSNDSIGYPFKSQGNIGL